MAMFHLLKIRTSIDILENESCKVTFGFENTLIVPKLLLFMLFFHFLRFWLPTSLLL